MTGSDKTRATRGRLSSCVSGSSQGLSIQQATNLTSSHTEPLCKHVEQWPIVTCYSDQRLTVTTTIGYQGHHWTFRRAHSAPIRLTFSCRKMQAIKPRFNNKARNTSFHHHIVHTTMVSIPHALSGWAKTSPNLLLTTKMVQTQKDHGDDFPLTTTGAMMHVQKICHRHQLQELLREN